MQGLVLEGRVTVVDGQPCECRVKERSGRVLIGKIGVWPVSLKVAVAVAVLGSNGRRQTHQEK